ncbi:MAG: sensor histidine kinase [Deltaproteobacteria bacterium]
MKDDERPPVPGLGRLRPSRVAFALGLVGLFAFPAIAFLTIRRSFGVAESIELHLRILDRLDEMLAALEMAESSARGYAVTKEPRLLRSYAAAINRFPAQTAALAALVGPAEQERLEGLRAIAAEHLGQLDQVIAEVDHGAPTSRLAPLFEDGFSLMTHAHEIHRAMRGDYRTRLRDLLYRQAQAERRTNLTLALGTALLVLTMLGAALLAQFEEQKRERLRARTQELQELVLGVVGHDLRSPLAAVSAGAGMLRRGTLTPEQVGRVAEQIQRSSQRMALLTRDLLDFTRARFLGSIELAPEPSDGSEICQRIVSEQRLAHPERTIELSVQGSASGLWDPARLEQLLANLVSNAVQHGDPERAIRVASTVEDARWSFEVHNAGAIPAPLLPLIFEPFSQGLGDAPGKHLGLGLFIVERIAHAHGGRVTVESSEQQGTTFKVVLPIVRASA